MYFISSIFCLIFIISAGYLLYKKYNPQLVLLLSGLLMLLIAFFFDMPFSFSERPTNFSELIIDIIDRNIIDVGLMIMSIGGYIAYMEKIGASNSLVYIAMKPFSIFKKNPYLLAAMIIPIGQLLFITMPSATGLGLLLVTAIFPTLVNMGVSKTSALSVIVASTAFDLGPSSINTTQAALLSGKSTLDYFIENQLPLSIPLTIFLTVLYYFVNKYFDKKEEHLIKNLSSEKKIDLTAPLIYGILPLLPLILLIFFSVFYPTVNINTTIAIFLSLSFAFFLELIQKKNIKEVFNSFSVFWKAMGRFFSSIVTLIISAQIFSTGLISIGFIDILIKISQGMGFGVIQIGIAMTLLIFLSTIFTGSGSASFFPLYQ